MFSNLLRDIEANTEGNPTAYADDLTIVVSGKSRTEIESKARYCVERTQGWCRKHKLSVSAQKSCFIQLKGTFRRGDTPDIRLEDGRAIHMVQTATYLGVEIDKGVRFHTHCVNVGEKAKNTFQKFKNIAKSKWGLEHESLQAIYRSIFVPTVVWSRSAGSIRNQEGHEKANHGAEVRSPHRNKSVSDGERACPDGDRQC